MFESLKLPAKGIHSIQIHQYCEMSACDGLQLFQSDIHLSSILSSTRVPSRVVWHQATDSG